MHSTDSEWQKLIQKIEDYVHSLTPEELKVLDEQLGIEEYTTPFGVLRIRRARWGGQGDASVQ